MYSKKPISRAAQVLGSLTEETDKAMDRVHTAFAAVDKAVGDKDDKALAKARKEYAAACKDAGVDESQLSEDDSEIKDVHHPILGHCKSVAHNGHLLGHLVPHTIPGEKAGAFSSPDMHVHKVYRETGAGPVAVKERYGPHPNNTHDLSVSDVHRGVAALKSGVSEIGVGDHR